MMMSIRFWLMLDVDLVGARREVERLFNVRERVRDEVLDCQLHFSTK